MTTITLGILGTSLLLQAALAWRLFSTRRELARVNARLQRHGEALTLLTDTSESGFGAVARELERLSDGAPRAGRKPAARKAAAPRRERTRGEEAAAEPSQPRKSSLRLHLA